ncbi:undecaprenyl-phosphate glucose phosphotransferase [Reyranella sp. CPCC 100927]|uniref:undecaprenyl-phosphate glucose phosphotransferase n=1 Tax=Reyranella sp. CPCC 100927 TaxID=2599616 RepID=UPI0011B571BA|nr:undecaprenyl-phosphate glucose phosphotransferase [Reyranella sp. CPCC 100927]TWT12994.1 undecaprenyl-phosphate glucose phosphotransferase [Reyranella sp. CPCC 100927]
MDRSKVLLEKKLLWAIRLMDMAVPAATAWIAIMAWQPEHFWLFESQYLLAMAASALLVGNVFAALGLYTIRTLSNVPGQMGRVALGWTGVVAVLLLAAFAAKVSNNFPRSWSILWYFWSLGGFIAVRFVVFALLSRWIETGRLTRNLAVVGAGPHGRRLIEHLRQQASNDWHIVGIWDERAVRPIAPVDGIPVRGTVDDLIAYAREHSLDQIVVALPWAAELRVMKVLKKLWELPIDIRLAPDMIGFSLAHCSYSDLGSVPVLNVFDRPLSAEKLMLKRLEDITLGLLMLVAFSPVMLLTALAVKLDSKGPILFRQTRYGFNNQRIDVWKFRSMYVEASRETAMRQATQDDPRVTRVGRFIRRTSIDELPQIFNVLSGVMSVVGPRPHTIGTKADNILFEEAVAEYAGRHRVKPGLTGWAQVNGWRGETDTIEKIQRRVDHDLYYIENWSLFLDLKIVLMTVFTVLRGKNAY